MALIWGSRFPTYAVYHAVPPNTKIAHRKMQELSLAKPGPTDIECLVSKVRLVS